MRNLKKAVILSNHFRSFNYIKEYVREFWGESTDFYISTWDYDYFYKTSEEIKSLEEYPGNLEELKRDKLDKSKLTNDIESFNPHSYLIHTDEDFMEWASGFNDFNASSKSTLLTKYGQLFSCIKGFELVKKSMINYDYIVRTRLDCIQHLQQYATWEKEFRKFDTSKKRRSRNNLMVEEFTVKEGFPYISDGFYYGNLRTLNHLYSNVHTKVNKIHDSGIFSDNDLKKKFLFHKLFGSLILGSPIDVKYSSLRNTIIRKNHEMENIDLNNLEDVVKVSSNFKDTKHNMVNQYGQH